MEITEKFNLIKSSGIEQLDNSKIYNTLNELSLDLSLQENDVNYLFEKVCNGLCDNLTLGQLNDLMSQCAASCITKHPDFGIIASRIAVKEMHRTTSESFFDKVEKSFQEGKYFTKEFYERVKNNRKQIEEVINYESDYKFSYFGLKTIQKGYLLKLNNRIFERPQDLYMRISLGIHYDSLEDAFETYRLLSEKCFTQATPTMFNAGTKTAQLSSCFLIELAEDSIEGIFKAVTESGIISKFAGGLGIDLSRLRAANSLINSTGGSSCGVIPVLKIFEATIRCIDQGGKKRPGSIAAYLEPWHADIFDFLDIRKNSGKEEMRTRDIFTALWIPDLFMERVKDDKNWSLFSPDIVPDLHTLYGEEFKKVYEEAEQKNLARQTIKAQKLWRAIISAQIETGTPYMLYKDTINEHNAQKNLGIIKMSNLCGEIVLYTDHSEIAVCNLASLGLPAMLVKKDSDDENKENATKKVKISDNENKTKGYFSEVSNSQKLVFTTEESEYYFDFDKLKYVASVAVKNLNKVIDINKYPLEATRKSNFRHRPIGLGIQGLADVFVMLRLPFDSDKAREFNRLIIETIYYSCLNTSAELAEKYGPYETYHGSPASKGILHFDMYKVKPVSPHDWTGLRKKIKNFGLRNSVHTAFMPTASTSQILGYNECFEPFTSNIYTRRTLAGDFQVVNQYLLHDLIKLNLWNDEMKNILIEQEGSIQNIANIPNELKALYKTSWELSMKTLMNFAADRAPFIDQTQSLNLFIAQPTYQKLTSMHFYGWKKKLKTGMYYLRTKPVAKAVQFTVDRKAAKASSLLNSEGSLQFSVNTDTDACENCSA